MNLRGQDGDIWELLDYRLGSQEKRKRYYTLDEMFKGILHYCCCEELVKKLLKVMQKHLEKLTGKIKPFFCGQVDEMWHRG